MSSIFNRGRFIPGLLIAIAMMRPSIATAMSGWQYELIDTAGVGKYSSMKIDSAGNLHLAYVLDVDDHPLKYAYWDRHLAKWFSMKIANEAGMCSLALDSKQHPHISYADYGSGYGAKLRHAYWDGVQWHLEPIRLNSEIVAYYNSITFDLNDHPSLTFYEYRGPKDSGIEIRLRNVLFNGQFWELHTVDPQGGSGKFNAMAADAQGGMHIAYANVSAGDMRYAYWNGHFWTRETVEEHSNDVSGAFLGYSAAIAVDKTGIPHVTYADSNNKLMKYAVRRHRWQIYVIERVGGVAYPDRNGIALDDEGHPFITYYDAGSSALRLAFQSHDRWVIGTVDQDNCGFTSSVQVSGGDIWISYASASGMKVAHGNLQSLYDDVQTTRTAPAVPRASK